MDDTNKPADPTAPMGAPVDPTAPAAPVEETVVNNMPGSNPVEVVEPTAVVDETGEAKPENGGGTPTGTV